MSLAKKKYFFSIGLFLLASCSLWKNFQQNLSKGQLSSVNEYPKNESDQLAKGSVNLEYRYSSVQFTSSQPEHLWVFQQHCQQQSTSNLGPNEARQCALLFLAAQLLLKPHEFYPYRRGFLFLGGPAGSKVWGASESATAIDVLWGLARHWKMVAWLKQQIQQRPAWTQLFQGKVDDELSQWIVQRTAALGLLEHPFYLRAQEPLRVGEQWPIAALMQPWTKWFLESDQSSLTAVSKEHDFSPQKVKEFYCTPSVMNILAGQDQLLAGQSKDLSYPLSIPAGPLSSGVVALRSAHFYLTFIAYDDQLQGVSPVFAQRGAALLSSYYMENKPEPAKDQIQHLPASSLPWCYFPASQQWIGSLKGSNPEQHLAHLLLLYRPHQLGREVWEDWMGRGRYLMLRKPFRLVLESQRVTPFFLEQILSMNLPVFHSDALGELLMLGPDFFMTDQRSNLKVCCRDAIKPSGP